MARLKKSWIDNLSISKSQEMQEWVFKYHLPSYPEAEIGTLEITRKNYTVARAYLDKRLRNHGLGRLLYEIALHDLGKLSTQYLDASDMAQRTWKSLIRDYRYETDFWSGTLTCSIPKKLRLSANTLLNNWRKSLTIS